MTRIVLVLPVLELPFLVQPKKKRRRKIKKNGRKK